MRQKVYCKNCKFIKIQISLCSTKFLCKLTEYIKDTPVKIKKEYNTCYSKNNKNDCSDYKCKWWKFWI